MNKNVKKVFSVLLCAIMIFSLFSVISFAEDTQKTTIEAEFPEGIIKPNTYFDVILYFNNVKNLNSCDCTVSFDNKFLKNESMCGYLYLSGLRTAFNNLDEGNIQFMSFFENGSFSGSTAIVQMTFIAYSEGEYTIDVNVNSWQGENQPENATFSFYIGDPDNKTEYQGLTYEIKNKEITITDCIEVYKGRLDIPAEIDGYPVTKISRDAFFSCNKITSIYIPETVTEVNIGLSTNNSELAKIIVDENNQFYSTDEQGVLFDKSKTKLLRYPVANTATEYKIPDSVTTITEYSFARAKNLTSVTIPDSVTTIEPAAFLATWNLEGIVIPESVTELSGNAFSCSGIKFAVIPESISVLNTRLFDCCTSLESVILPASITSVDDFAFSMCNSLAHIYYKGSEADWNRINVSDNDNSALLNAEIHYDSTDYFAFDVDGNGKISAADARLALRASAGLESLSIFAQSAADVDGNGKITAADARKILRKSAGLE